MEDRSFTTQAEDYFLDILELDKAAIWNDIESTPSDTPAELWKKKLEGIGREYALSGRYALMRLLCCRARGVAVCDGGQTVLSAEGGDFTAVAGEKEYCFADISAEHAAHMSPEESLQYLDYLQELSRQQADWDPELNAQVFSRVWFDEAGANAAAESRLEGTPRQKKAARAEYEKKHKKFYKNRMTRQEAFLLGHILDFSLEEMQWFLLRTQHEQECFRFSQSEDLIEAYGFLTGSSWKQVERLKQAYAEQTEGLKKQEDFLRETGFTRDISDSLPGMVERWQRRPETMEAEFLKWMVLRAPGLDVPSCTAGRIYRNLAAMAYELAAEQAPLPEETELPDLIRRCCEEEESQAAQQLLYRDGELCPAECKRVADRLMLKNKQLADSLRGDNTAVWHVLDVREDGRLYPAGGVVNTGRTRVADLLQGKVQAEKGDLLYLLWFTANLLWQYGDPEDPNTICCRVLDFMDGARCLLEEAMLPDFYPPHPMEQSMLLAIVSGRDEDNTPAAVYEAMLEAMQDRRNRQKGSRKHGGGDKLAVVKHYRAHPELTLAECAELFGISPKTLSAWQKELLEQGLLE